MPSHVKTYDGSEDLEDHLKIFLAAAKVERWAMPTWCHMFNSTLTGSARVWFDDLPPESVDSYDDLKEAFLANFRQQKKCIKDPVEIHHIKQREGESTEDFVRRFKVESRDVKGAPKIIRISGFMHGITNPELFKCLHNKIIKSVDELMRITTSFLRGEVAAGNQERKKSLPPWKHQEAGHKQNFKKGGFKNQQRQIEELLKNGKLSHVIKELKKNNGNDQPKANKKGETSQISFPPLEEEGTEGPIIIEAEIGGHFIHRMYVDGGVRWREIILPLGKLSLLVKIGDEEHSTSVWMNFVVVRSSSPYNGIIGRPGVRKIQAVPSTAHGMLKFPVAGGVLTLRSSKIIPIECATFSGPEGQPPPAHLAINPDYPEQTIMIGSTLTQEGRSKLCDLLQRNLNVFAWKPADMTGVPRYIAEHRLNIREGCPPVRQKRRSQAADRNQAIQEEVEKLVDAGIMKEVYYHSWLFNPVMVKKHDDSWRMCVNFKDLNKACPKDGYPLPEIDWNVESLCEFPFKCFLDAYKGYHQIKMAKEDEDKTSFITSKGVFCYSNMPFGLRNAGVTYQRLADKAFHKQIGRNLEVYVDDLVIKSHTEDEIIRDIEETFKTLWEINMKLNPKNDVQKLNGKLASLNRFLAKSAEKSLPFFKTLKKCTKKSDFHWTEEAEAAFKQMKQLIAELPTLTAPEEKEELIVYLAATKEAVSAVLMTEREAKQMC
ncbi:reverse transcriptase domain-containing protein [Tanacetum coccineum]